MSERAHAPLQPPEPPGTRPIGVSLVAFDGLSTETALEAIAAAGATHAEPAFIAGTMVFTEADFSDRAAAALRRAIAASGLGCVAVSAHMDCGADDAAERLARRLRFAAGVGARFVITNTATRARRDAFLRTATQVLRVAEREQVALAFENPGHGPQDLLRCAADAAPLLAALDSPWAALNYDIGNVLTNSEGELRPEADFAAALPVAQHFHLKEMARRDQRWEYLALGDGELDYGAILPLLAAASTAPLCVELPFAQVRRCGLAPVRGDAPAAHVVIDAVRRSLRRLRQGLAAAA